MSVYKGDRSRAFNNSQSTSLPNSMQPTNRAQTSQGAKNFLENNMRKIQQMKSEIRQSTKDYVNRNFKQGIEPDNIKKFNGS